MGWIPKWGSLWMVITSVFASYFVSVTPSMGISLSLLRRIEVSTLWSSFFLSFMCFVNCTLWIQSYWAYIHLSVSASHVYSYVIGLPNSGWYPPDPSICLRMYKFIVFNSWVVFHYVNVPHFLYPSLCWGASICFLQSVLLILGLLLRRHDGFVFRM